jgi:predicted nucleic acid-binding Zn ribbon protein
MDGWPNGLGQCGGCQESPHILHRVRFAGTDLHSVPVCERCGAGLIRRLAAVGVSAELVELPSRELVETETPNG